MNKRIPAVLLALTTAFTLGATACTVDADDDEDNGPTIVDEEDDEDVDVDIDESP